MIPIIRFFNIIILYTIRNIFSTEDNNLCIHIKLIYVNIQKNRKVIQLAKSLN